MLHAWDTGHGTRSGWASGASPSPQVQGSEEGPCLLAANAGRAGGCHFWAEPAGGGGGLGALSRSSPGISSCGCGCRPRLRACTQRRSPCSPAAGERGPVGAWRAPGPDAPPTSRSALGPRPAGRTFCRMRFRQTLSSQSMSGSPRPGSFLESRRYTSTSTSGSASASCEARKDPSQPRCGASAAPRPLCQARVNADAGPSPAGSLPMRPRANRAQSL